MDPTFSSARLSLLDRGFAFAICHIRGGQEMGRAWYENGRLMRKMNTFTDFIDCAEFLIQEKWTSPAHLYAMGGSAGGLLMGAVANLRPDLYHGMVAQVPFVDVVTTMLDDTIPLTTGEYDEWGNPNEEAFYTYMKSYSPYDNVTRASLPQPARHDRPARLAGTVLGTRQVGGPSPRAENRRQPGAAALRHGNRPRRCLGPLQAAARCGAGVRLFAGIGRERSVGFGWEGYLITIGYLPCSSKPPATRSTLSEPQWTIA